MQIKPDLGKGGEGGVCEENEVCVWISQPSLKIPDNIPILLKSFSTGSVTNQIGIRVKNKSTKQPDPYLALQATHVSMENWTPYRTYSWWK